MNILAMEGLNIKMIINVYSLDKANKKILSDIKSQKNWISIRDYGYSELYKYINICKNICIIEFDDVTYYEEKHDLLISFFKKIKEKREFIHFTEDHAKKILNFAIDIFNKNEELNIHCYAGKSRSQAVGYVLNQYFNLYLTNNKEDFIRNIMHNNEKFMGNTDVIKVMNKILYIK